MEERTCIERHDNCIKRMDSQAADIDNIYSLFVSWRVFYWTLGIMFFLIIGSYSYTTLVLHKVDNVVTQEYMEKFQENLVKELQGGK